MDNWSFGLLVHEIITGKRPFLPHLSPAQWIPIISQKNSQDICAFHDMRTGKVTFSNQISMFNQISETLKTNIETWLRIMFEWDPKKRGGKGAHQELLVKILDKTMIEIFVLNTLESFSYEIFQEMKLNEFKMLIDSNTKISPKDQLLIAKIGSKVIVDSHLGDGFLKQIIESNVNNNIVVYVLDKSKSLTYSPYSTTCIIPPSVEEILLNPTKKVTFEDQKYSWKHFIWVSQKIIKKYHHVIDSYNSFTYHCAKRILSLRKSFSQLECEIFSFQKCGTFLMQGVKFDIENLKGTKSTNELICYKFLKICQEVVADAKANLLKESQIDSLVSQIHSLNVEQLKLEDKKKTFNINPLHPNRTSPFKTNSDESKVFDTYVYMLQLFDDMRRKTKEERMKITKSAAGNNAFDNTQMVKLLCDLFQYLEKLVKDVYIDFNKLYKLLTDINDLSKTIEKLRKKNKDEESYLKQLLMKQHKSLWSINTTLNVKDELLTQNFKTKCEEVIHNIDDLVSKIEKLNQASSANLKLVDRLLSDSNDANSTDSSSSPLPSDWSII